eukprot:TRINITY_DN2693_c0_g1_i1.p1 TRINITY_DN2693_c0_g1~~TRINITY_DN2693_c0_g1_i1.p1  ORF type:complete len:124 (+),score=3.94 TRINITY_DN2693_c0_g1_i1:28-399(+)
MTTWQKPFEPRELVARVQVLLRRFGNSQQTGGNSKTPETLKFEGMTLYLTQHRLEVDNCDLKLTGMEFNLLAVLAINMGKVLSRDQIISELKGIEVELFSRSVDILLSRLRQKLTMIHTHLGL